MDPTVAPSLPHAQTTILIKETFNKIPQSSSLLKKTGNFFNKEGASAIIA